MPTQIGPFQGVYNPDYDLRFWTAGDPRRPVGGVDFRSALSINTSKNLTDISGTFSITLKDHRARRALHPMDVGKIALGGHGAPVQTVLKCIVDEVGEATDANGNAVSELTQITGRCLGKYLQINSLFLPVWDASGALPTALIFGMGDITDKVDGNIVKRSTPRSIMDYLVKRFVYGKRGKAGFPGTPNARFWLDPSTRFEDIGFHVPFIQFNEDAVASAAKQLEVLGFSECWMDELGALVYRQPQWDQAATYLVPTDSLIRDSLSESDVGCATYLEVVPAGDPGVDAAASQALRSGRAPVPASYLKTQKARDRANVTAEFVIDTDANGNVTATGEKNYWRRKQVLLGVRPQQVISPLLWDRAQAQAQAEGLLRFYSRLQKSGTITTPMRSDARIGTNLRLFGQLNGVSVDTAYYVEGVAHQYIEGGECVTVWTVTHGADRGDPRWGRISIPTFDPATLAAANGGGVMSPGSSNGADAPAGQTGDVKPDPGNGSFVSQTTRPDGQRVLPKAYLSEFLSLLAGQLGHTLYTNTYSRHPRESSTNTGQSEHWTGNACDLHTTPPLDSPLGKKICFHAMRMCGASMALANQAADQGTKSIGSGWDRFPWTNNGAKYSVQIIWMAPDGSHHDHVHIGIHPA